MQIIKATVPQNGQVTPAFDTQGLPIALLTYFGVDVLDGTPSLKFQTPRPGQDPNSATTTWIDVLEISPGISTDADDAGAIAPTTTRPVLEIPNLILEGAGAARNYVYLVQSGKRIPKFFGAAASTPGHDAAAAFAEADQQELVNQVSRLSNSFPPPRLPNILRINLGVNQTTAAVDFFLGLAEPNRFVNNPQPYTKTVNIANGAAFSEFFELAPGEKLVGIATPAAFTTVDLTLETPKFDAAGKYLDPAVTTDANWLAVGEYVTEQTILTGSTPGDIFKWVGAAQDQFLAVPDMSQYLELPRYMRLKGSGNQGGARVVTLYIQ